MNSYHYQIKTKMALQSQAQLLKKLMEHPVEYY